MANLNDLDRLPPEVLRRYEQALFEDVGIEFDDDDPVWCDAREIIICGGWRAGKSTRGAGKVFKSILRPTENGLIWLLGPDYPQTDEEFRYLLEWCTHYDLITKALTPSQGQKTLILKTGWKIVTKSARYPEKLGSVAPNGILLCEPGQMGGEVYTMVQGRLAQKRGWMFAAGTIEDDSAHRKWAWYEALAREWMDHDDGDTQRAFSLPSWKNRIVFPGGENDPEIERLRMLYSDYTFKRRIAGEPVGLENPCFPGLWEEGAEDKFKKPVKIDMVDGAIGVDFGTTADHPSSVVAVTRDIDGNYWIREVWLETGGNVDAIALAVQGQKMRYDIRRGRVDPHEAVLAQRLGFNIAVGGGTYGVPTEYRIGIGNGLLEDGYLYFDRFGPNTDEAYKSMRLMRKLKDNQGRLVYGREIGDDAAQAVLYALEELHGEQGHYIAAPSTQLGGIRFSYGGSRAGLVGRA